MVCVVESVAQADGERGRSPLGREAIKCTLAEVRIQVRNMCAAPGANWTLHQLPSLLPKQALQAESAQCVRKVCAESEIV